ncbi:MAG: DsrE family protein [Deferribacterales bacterium]
MSAANSNKSLLAVIWSSSDKEVARNNVFTYTLNARCRDWWSDVHLVIWGPSVKLAAHDSEIQNQLRDILKAGVSICACDKHAAEHKVADNLRNLGITVHGVDEPVREMLRNGAKVITF